MTLFTLLHLKRTPRYSNIILQKSAIHIQYVKYKQHICNIYTLFTLLHLKRTPLQCIAKIYYNNHNTTLHLQYLQRNNITLLWLQKNAIPYCRVQYCSLVLTLRNLCIPSAKLEPTFTFFFEASGLGLINVTKITITTTHQY